MKVKVIGIIIVIGICLFGYFLISNNKRVEIGDDIKIVGIFKYGDDNINVNFSDDDIFIIQEIFNGKRIYKNGDLSCGFSEDVSIIINDNQKFYFALDGCPYVYYENEKRYFDLNDIEDAKLKEVLGKYGFRFPCV